MCVFAIFYVWWSKFDGWDLYVFVFTILFMYGDQDLMYIHDCSNIFGFGFSFICMVVYLQWLCMTFGYVIWNVCEISVGNA